MNIKTAIYKGIQLTNKSVDLLAILLLLSLCSFFGMLYFSPELLKPASSGEPNFSIASIAFLATSFMVTIFSFGATINYIYRKAKFGDASLADFTSGGQKYFWRMVKFFSICSLIMIISLAPVLFLFFLICEFSFIAAILTCIIPLFYAVKLCGRYLLLVPCILVVNNDSLASARSKSKKIFSSNLFSFMVLSIPFIVLPQIASAILKHFITSANLPSLLGTHEGIIAALLITPLSTYAYIAFIAATIEYFLGINPESTTIDEQNLATT